MSFHNIDGSSVFIFDVVFSQFLSATEVLPDFDDHPVPQILTTLLICTRLALCHVLFECLSSSGSASLFVGTRCTWNVVWKVSLV